MAVQMKIKIEDEIFKVSLFIAAERQ